MKLLNSYFTGVAQLENFEQPLLAADIIGNLDLEAFNKFFPIPNVEQIGGNVNLDLAFKMQFFDPEYRKDKFEILSSIGKLNLKNVSYKHIENDLVYENISGDVLIQDNDAAVRELSIITAKSNLILNGAMKNIMKYLDGSGSLGMVASVESTKIDLNEFIGESNTNSSATPTKFELPLNLNLNIDLKVDQLSLDSHQFQNINAKLLLANRKAEVPRFSLNALGGGVRGNISLDNLMEAGNVIDGELVYNGVNMKALFTDWKNFNQTTITDKHLSGVGNGSIDLLLFFNPYFSIIEDKIDALSQVEITNGELKNLETMKMVTDYMRSNKALNIMLNKHINKFEEKLLNLKFSTLSNQILIKNRKIEIPRMTISTNALDVDFFGWHDFDNNVEYHFSFRFRDLKTVAEYTEFGKVVDDGLGLVIYLTMTGPVDNPSFSLDKEERKNALKQNLSEEKQTIKSILKTDFGLFKNDSTVQKMQQENKKQVEFIFYEDESEEDLKDSTGRSGNKKFTGKFFEKLDQDADKQKRNVIFEKEK